MSMIRNPAHYGGDVWWEHVKIAEQMGWGYLVGNATKYLWRVDKKSATSTVQDVEKALWYLERRLTQLRRIQSSTALRITEWGMRWWRTRTFGVPEDVWTQESLLSALYIAGVPPFARETIRLVFYSGLVPIRDEISALSSGIGELRHEIRRRTVTSGRIPAGPIPVSAIGDPVYEKTIAFRPDELFDETALAVLLDIDDSTAMALIRATTTSEGRTIEEMARRVGVNSTGRTHEQLRDLVRTYCNCVRWADTKTPYRIDVDPEDTTRVG